MATLSIAFSPHDATEPKKAELYHQGVHDHIKPHFWKPDLKSLKKLKDIIAVNPASKPKNLLVGTIDRPSVANIHPSLGNLNTVGYYRRSFLKNNDLSLGDIFKLEESVKERFFSSTSLSSKDAHITIQTSFMKEQQCQWIDTGFQSDSIHGFVVDTKFQDINVTFTSGKCKILNRNVPIAISIMFDIARALQEALFGFSEILCIQNF
ncbi:hypothetical protein BCR41DRAFT_219049 [Lobosporangium transversale]|uniref:Uncharacterized protein n=1 Tax=Lobosporangium transversale TaxID=64571 RepID=A0A1Y2GVE8_9FUNG|nr:hypothetical protein BCR41DRAFT_219049 [Lobosporangium transversale]ORZ26245.1 hypothetical protein BCR41DRAFT_219049 [Lobosporangium transversale]|eukprot:XP_021884010.1 hypothetical protein BCR41DRAFT_219049 [Lobosporangium transversale]